MNILVSKTINQLHFEDLDPVRFEELIFSMVYRMKQWNKIDHFGKMGRDGGVDIRAIEMSEDNINVVYYFQCKRYSRIRQSDLKTIIDDYNNGNYHVPDVYVLVLSCSLTRDNIEYFEKYALEQGFNSAIIWSKSVIEAMLYSNYQDLLLAYFGVGVLHQKGYNRDK